MADREATIKGERCSDVGTPPTPSARHPCVLCGAKVWIDRALFAEISSKYERVQIVCMRCDVDDHEMGILPSQVQIMLDSGASPMRVASVIAASEVAGPNSTPADWTALQLRIRDDPRSVEAIAWRIAFGKASSLVQSVLRRN